MLTKRGSDQPACPLSHWAFPVRLQKKKKKKKKKKKEKEEKKKKKKKKKKLE